MQVTKLDRRITCSGEIVSSYKAGERCIQLIGTFTDREMLDDLLYAITCQKITKRLGQKRDNIVPNGGFDII